MKTKISRASLSEILQSNHSNIQRIMSLSEFEYKAQIFEQGMNFLEGLYKTDRALINTYSFLPTYWRWWMSEFYRWEFEYLHFYNQHEPLIFPETWEIEMIALINEGMTHEGFRNHLKLFHNVCI